ncbi:AMSH-like protease sst2 [Pleurostoma richardsiae]|uniref:AMSH-like protease sst2 n=1 Tax=Pleurostoma richardsiae TaxID=41990 RepID=A0AA38RT49_9PEZI|nr:AMSH-like protease sst2 [Pleurostoma richardsiae]
MDTSSTFLNRPQSSKEISREAEEFTFNTHIPLKQWIRAAETLYREGNVCKREGNLPRAYLIFLRHTNLVVDQLKKHPEYKTAEGKRLVKPLLARIPRVIDQLEEIKPRINEAYAEWEKVHASQREAAASGHRPKSQEDNRSLRSSMPWAPQVPSKVLDAGENQELAVDLAEKEFRRRDAARRSTRQAGISEEEEQHRRGAGVWDSWDNGPLQDDGLRQQMEATRRQLDLDQDVKAIESAYTRNDRFNAPPDVSSVSYHYPQISKSTPLRYESSTNELRREPIAYPPSRPPKELLSSRYDSTPSRPSKEPARGYGERPPSSPLSAPPLPELPPKVTDNPPSRKERVTFKPAAYLENGKPMRPIFLPATLRRDFLSLAQPNTRRGLEMCGILCGTAVNDALFINCLLIPEQKCTSDTCETDNEGAVLEYCMSEDLMIFGWIHTHPTQTCFMSSRDMHTQAGYQAMMPESIAIVCAPKFEPSWGIFRLTDPPGLPHILQCERTETFHQHFIDDLYTDAVRPQGHVYESHKLDFKIKDLRPKQ